MILKGKKKETEIKTKAELELITQVPQSSVVDDCVAHVYFL